MAGNGRKESHVKRRTRLSLVIFVLGALTGVFSFIPAASAHPTDPLAAKPLNQSLTVRSGDSLSALFGSRWMTVAAFNNLKDPNVIYPGEVLRLPSGTYVVPRTYLSGLTSSKPQPYQPRASSPVSYGNGWTGPWACIAHYESGGNPAENTGNGYYGGLQFVLSTWYAYGGVGNPANASIAEQETVANKVLAADGWGQWPNTSQMCGYR